MPPSLEKGGRQGDGVSASPTALSPFGSSPTVSPASPLQSHDAGRVWYPHLDYAGEPMREGEFRDAPEVAPLDQRTFTNCVRSLFNIDGYLLPELTAEQQGQFIRDPVRYFIGTDKAQQDAIWREVAKRQVLA